MDHSTHKASLEECSLTAKENFKKVFYRQKPQWIPTREDYLSFSPRILPDNTARALINEAQQLQSTEIKGGNDMFGIAWTYVAEVQGAITKPGNPTLKQLSGWEDIIRWPDPDSWEWTESADNNRKFLEDNSEKFVSISILSGFFERLISFLDFENACLSLIDEDEKPAVHILFDRLCSLYESIILKLKQHFNPDMIELHDDWGAQRSPFFSLQVCREMILPYLKRLVAFCHSQGLYFQLHSCGCVEPLVPAIIEAGVDMWIPQNNANDLARIQRDFGDRFVTAIRRQLMPNASDEDAKHLIDRFFDIYGQNWIQKPVLFFDDFPSRTAVDYFRAKFKGI